MLVEIDTNFLKINVWTKNDPQKNVFNLQLLHWMALAAVAMKTKTKANAIFILDCM